MRISRIFTSIQLEPQSRVLLDERASHYASKVLRLKPGHELLLFNGDGAQYSATINALEKKTVAADINAKEPTNNESNLHTHLGIAVSKGDRMDWIIQKATELGVTKITPLFTERTELKLNPERLEKKIRHWQQIVISASEQCGRNILADINSAEPLSQWLGNTRAEKKFVLHHRATNRLDTSKEVSSVAILIGPEGGLSEKEILLAEKAYYESICFGPRVLRTETAPIATLAILQNTWGDF